MTHDPKAIKQTLNKSHTVVGLSLHATTDAVLKIHYFLPWDRLVALICLKGQREKANWAEFSPPQTQSTPSWLHPPVQAGPGLVQGTY